MARITTSIAGLPNEANIKNAEVREVVRKYNIALQQLITTIYGDTNDHETRIKALEDA